MPVFWQMGVLAKDKETHKRIHFVKELNKFFNMKVIPGICMHLGCLVLVMLHMALPLRAETVGLECTKVTYLEAGMEGMISCALESFYSVSWYTKKDYDDFKSPFVYWSGEEHGQLDEYGIHPDGSFIIIHVSLSHSGSYIVEVLQDLRRESVVMEVHVQVYVIPNPSYPVVDGHLNQQHVYMDVNRGGELGCSMRHVYPNISLAWTVVDPNHSGKIHFHDAVVSRTQNEDQTYDITFTSLYQVTDYSILRIAIQCGVADEVGEVLSEKTTVDLLFSAVYPVVNGHVNQKHVYLDVEREGHLRCVKENVDAGTRLFWALDPAIRGKVTFQSTSIVSTNDDGAVNINQTFDYVVHDNSLERITVECKLLEPDSDEHSFTTTVNLLLRSDPVISGCYHEPHNCILEVKRQGELTCTVKNSQYPVYLEWRTFHGGVDYFEFGETRVEHQSNTNLHEVSITTQYTFLDESVTFLMVRCDAYRSDSDQLLATAVASLNIQSDGEYNKSSQGTPVGISLSTMVLVIAVLLIVSISYCINRRHYKKSETKYMDLLCCKQFERGYCSPEDTIEQTSPLNMRALPVSHETEGCAVTIPQDSDSSRSAPADSGNSGSNSRERSESESSEKNETNGLSKYHNDVALLEDKGGQCEETPMV